MSISIKKLHIEAYPFNGWGWELHEDGEPTYHYTTDAQGDGLWMITRDVAGVLCEVHQVAGTCQFSLPLPSAENKKKAYGRIRRQMAGW